MFLNTIRLGSRLFVLLFSLVVVVVGFGDEYSYRLDVRDLRDFLLLLPIKNLGGVLMMMRGLGLLTLT